MNPPDEQKPAAPFMVLDAREIERLKMLENVLHAAMLVVADCRFDGEEEASCNFANLANAVRQLPEWDAFMNGD